MARLRVQVLKPGTWVVGRNQDGSLNKHTFTPEYIRSRVLQGAEMLQKGINIPYCFAHLNGQKPRQMSLDNWKAEKEKHTAGWVEKFYVAKQDGSAYADVEIPDADDFKKVAANRFCSPEIVSFTDGTGTNWPDAITHLASTHKPAQTGLEPAITLSGEGWQISGPVMRLARDPSDGSDEYDPPKKKPNGKKPPKNGDDSGDDNLDDLDEGEGMSTGDVYNIAEALRGIGMPIPDRVKDAEGLCIAIEASGPNSNQNQMELEEISPAQGGTGGGATPMMMSSDATKRMSALEAENAALRLARFNDKKADLVKRLGRLFKSGRCDKAEHDAQIALIKPDAMRLSSTGDVEETAVEIWVKSRETLKGSLLPLNGAANGMRLSADQIDPDPQMTGGPRTPDQRKADKELAKRHARGDYSSDD